MFRRRKDRGEAAADALDADVEARNAAVDGGDDDDTREDDTREDDARAGAAGEATGDATAATAGDAATLGPWDAADAPDDDVVRLDLGSLRIPGGEGLEIQLNLDDASGTVMAVTVVKGDSALQLQAFAAPRGEGIWPEVRRELAAEITRDGGLADADDDEVGGTLRAKLPFPQPDGSTTLGPVLFVGTDGPRWMLRGVLSGQVMQEPRAAEELLAVYRGVVVERGTEAYAPREPLPLRLPDGAPPPPGPA